MHEIGAVRLSETDLPALIHLCVRCSDFFELVEGRPATRETAEEILGPLDPAYAPGVNHVWGIKRRGALIAVADLLDGYPAAGDWNIGLLLIDPEHRRQGVGSQFCKALMSWIASHGGSTVRLIVQQQNPGARSFWERQGFVVERESVQPARDGESRVWVLGWKTDPPLTP